jgi:pilus assembly protein Flp/PilA
MMTKVLLNIAHDEQGATAIEYALLLGLVAMSVMVGVTGLASEVNKMWSKVSTTVSNSTSAA